MIDNTPKKRGRPRAFDEDTAVDRAVELFWTSGYDATSLDALAAAMGMGRPSIYNAFGDKRALFLRSLQRYVETVAAGPVSAMREAADVESAIRALLRATVEYVTSDPDHAGCLLLNVAPVAGVDGSTEFVARSLAWSQSHVEERLATAVASGELPSDYDPERGARRTIDAMLAIGARARLGATAEDLLDGSDDAAAAVLR